MARIEIYQDGNSGPWLLPEGHDVLIDMSGSPDGVGLTDLRTYGLTWDRDTFPETCYPTSKCKDMTHIATYSTDMDSLILRMPYHILGDAFVRWMGQEELV